MAQPPSEPRPHHVYELPDESEERLERLFNQLDSNGDGRIDVNDLTEGLKRLNIPFKPGDAEHIIKAADISQSNDLNFAEFVHYLQEHEKQLLLVFRALDANKDGRVDEVELVSSFKELGVHITPEEANRLLRRVMFMTGIG
ncbi:UNVERIFIED_CONTAM: hypothetical protein GTU68_043960 [Idotea baltica]|nr:hypothetical protein [Idotea baltica]